ncbi:MAG: radical SAM protein [Candidatus Tectomicrobia bacterium]|uniref:Radical SAM protein n=1 Tax=Tectimicrobiota bacterium TaxID=2528274 RepID=A0A932CL63_UNCTE|nr:radical SAM protein [Candidatus Tectomicrobia bacterium]
MKILLISPPTLRPLRADMSDLFEKESGLYPPLGLLYLAARLQEEGRHPVKVLDGPALEPIRKPSPRPSSTETTRENGGVPDRPGAASYEAIEQEIREFRPQVVGIQTLTFTLIDALAVAEIARRIDPEIHVCLGGPHVYLYPQESLGFPFIDSLILGEGEITLPELLDALEAGRPLEGVPGIAFRREGEVVLTEPRPLIEALDSLPFPDRSLIPYQRYYSVLGKEGLMTTLLTSRGCPFSCIYCGRFHIGKRFRARSARNVVDEMAACVAMGIGELQVFDDIFTLDKRRALAVCHEIVRRGLKISWAIRSRVDTVDPELLDNLARAGCRRISYGVESGSDEILKNLKKGITTRKAEEAVRMAQEAGLTVLADFMLGSPGETREHVLRTIEFALKLRPDFAQFTVTTPYPATELYLEGLRQGVIARDYWQEFAQNPQEAFVTPFWNEHLVREELLELFRLAYRRFYLRPSYVLRRFQRLGSWKEFKHAARAGMRVFRVANRQGGAGR